MTEDVDETRATPPADGRYAAADGSSTVAAVTCGAPTPGRTVARAPARRPRHLFPDLLGEAGD